MTANSTPPFSRVAALAAASVAFLAPLAAQEPTDILIQERAAVLPDWAEDSFRRVDASYDGWRSEVLHDAAKKPLKKIVAWVADGHAAAPEAGLFAPDFAMYTALRPKELETVHEARGVVVRRAASVPALAATTDLASQVGALRAALRGAHPHPFFKFIQILPGPDSLRAKALLHWSVENDQGRLVQVNAIWMTDWAVDAEDHPTLRGIAVLEYEEIEAPRPIFREITGHLARDLEFWDREILTGIEDYHEKTDRLLGRAFVGSQGFAIGDANGDGLDDLYICNQGGLPNRLLLHGEDGRFVDATTRAGVGFLEGTRSALFLDLDNDGDQDLVCSIESNLLVAYNDGTGRYGNLTAVDGDGREHIYSLSAADADNDGDLDLYAVRYVANGIMGGVPTPYHNADNGASNFYWRNDGVGKFTNATAEVGLDQNNTKFSLASIWEDFDDDGDLDLYVANDFGDNNLYLNEGGHFRDVATERGAQDRAAGMGLSTADFDLDGNMDVLITNMFSSAGLRIAPQDQFQGEDHAEVAQEYVRHARGNTLLANRGGGHFEDVTEHAGIAVGGWSWGSQFVDFDNNGYPDIYSPNGFITGPIKDDL